MIRCFHGCQIFKTPNLRTAYGKQLFIFNHSVLLIDFKFQYYNIDQNFQNDQPWQVRYKVKAHNPGKVDVIFLRPYNHYMLP